MLQSQTLDDSVERVRNRGSPHQPVRTAGDEYPGLWDCPAKGKWCVLPTSMCEVSDIDDCPARGSFSKVLGDQLLFRL